MIFRKIFALLGGYPTISSLKRRIRYLCALALSFSSYEETVQLLFIFLYFLFFAISLRYEVVVLEPPTKGKVAEREMGHRLCVLIIYSIIAYLFHFSYQVRKYITEPC